MTWNERVSSFRKVALFYIVLVCPILANSFIIPINLSIAAYADINEQKWRVTSFGFRVAIHHTIIYYPYAIHATQCFSASSP